MTHPDNSLHTVPLSSILNAMEEVIWSVRWPDFVPIFITPSVERLYGISHQAFMANGRLWEECIHPDERTIVARILTDLANTDEYSAQYRIVTRTGTIKWVHNRGKLIRDAAGQPMRVDGIVSDITQRQEALLALEKTKELLSQTSRIASIGGWEIDVPTRRLLWSEVTFAIHEVDPATTEPNIEMALNFYKPGASQTAIRTAVQRCMEAGEPFDLELEFITAKGRELWVRAVGQPTFAHGRCVKVWGVFQDITARKHDEEARRMLEAAVQAAPLGVIVCDARQADRPIVYTNPAISQITGYAQHEILGRNPRFLHGGEAEQAGLLQLRQALAAGTACHVELRNFRKDGSPYLVELSVAPVQGSDGSLKHFVGIQRDITQQRRLQQQLLMAQKIEAVGRLAAGVAHDYNNALQSILGNTELALNHINQGPLLAFLEEIRAAAQRSTTITRQLLGLTRNPLSQPRPIDLNAVAEQLISMLRRLIREDIQLYWSPERDLWPVLLDPAQIDQIITNLTLNARDAIGAAGTIAITTSNVEVREAIPDGPPPGKFILLTVRDNGSGMDRETQARLFEPFFTTKPVGQGTGIGLPSVANIVQQNHGVIMVESALGAGTTVRVYLPQAPSPALPEARKTARIPLPTATINVTVLLCEDDSAVRDLGQRILVRLGYSVLTAASPSAALNLIARHPGPIDILITDVVMPELSGTDLLHQARKIRPKLHWLFMSGHSAETLGKDEIPDADHFIQKPFTIGELAAKVQGILRHA
ncbi:MAG: PAS domain S-box protein [Candidatus Viridilinea halotolerans]|uniref:histidine kinase n=1 Tax=Candidatus Viridilinea halotolerans TaxID=2491704 RepID=A0A426U8H0_9CHLR|nr:MAG: PAS domain S-box protein [Candidatus Viridilinea halotolerans]